MKHTLQLCGVVALFYALYHLVTIYDTAMLVAYIEAHRLLGACFLGLIMFGTTVVAPLTSMPLIPVMAPMLGAFTTGTACFIGWFLGALVAFLIGRHVGRSVLEKFISFEKISKLESKIPPESSFMLIVALRMILPVDVASYALGVFSTVSFRVYALATGIGIGWFSYAFSYGSVALMSHDYVLFSYIGVASVFILCGAWWYARRTLRK